MKCPKFVARLTVLMVVLLTQQGAWGNMNTYVKIDLDGRSQHIDLTPQTAGDTIKLTHPDWIKDPDQRRQYVIAGSKKPLATDSWTEVSFTITPQKSGTARLSLRSGYCRGDIQTWTAYRNLNVTGATLPKLPDKLPGRLKRTKGQPHVYFAAHDVGLPLTLQLTANQPFTLTCQAQAAPPQPRKLTPVKADPLDQPPPRQASDNMPPSYYSYYGPRVKYLPLKDKGLIGEQIARHPKNPSLKPKRPLPVPQFRTQTQDKPNLPTKVRATVQLLEEQGIQRPNTPIRFGLPLPQGHIFKTGDLKVLNPNGQEVPAQFAITGLWPDQSAKWMLVQFSAPLKPHQLASYQVVDGTPAEAPKDLTWTKLPNGIAVDTGKLKAVVNRQLLTKIVVDGKNRGGFLPPKLICEDETEAPVHLESITPEENGPEVLQLLLKGRLGTVASFEARLRFRRNSAVVRGEFSFLNDNLQREFTDYTSLCLTYAAPTPIAAMSVDGNSKQDRYFQSDEHTLNGKEGAMSGTAAITCQDGSAFNLAIRDASLRYPKALSFHGNSVNLEFLPQQPSKTFGYDLPYYLRYPFREGKYRMKWGMSFTETFLLDFSGATPELTAAETNRPIIAVLDRDWYATTQALPGIPPADDHTFDIYDTQLATAVQRHHNLKKQQREWGFMNLGDWFGERIRNWGNNEYDLPYGLFIHFARTGNRDAARLASWAAIHQADVDIVHAYPDPYYVGANAQHGIGHTGINYQNVERATWTHRYDVSYEANNGHTWARGMMTEWALNGNARVMTAALMLGEHICNYMAPSFKKLGTHERSAGWSLNAILGIYDVTGDPEHLNAARQIVEIPLREQNFKMGGAWPHTLPLDHSAGVRGRVGNCPYLIGILLEGLNRYFDATHDPRIVTSLVAATGWLKRIWDWENLAWHYGVTWDGQSCNGPSPGLSSLIAPQLMKAANLTNDKELFDIAATVMDQITFKGMSAAGKSLGISTVNMAGLIDGLIQWNQTHPNQKYTYSSKKILQKTLKKLDSSFKLRAPDHKVFKIRLLKDNPTLTVTRTKHGARPKCKPTGNLAFKDPQGKTLITDDFTTKEAFARTYSLKGKAGETFQLHIDDDLTAVWSILPEDNALTTAVMPPQASVDGRTLRHFFFTVPAGATSFKVHFRPVHSGNFMVTVLDEQNQLQQNLQDTYNGVCWLPWLDTKETKDPHRVLNLTFAAAPHDRTWQLLTTSGGDLCLWLEGIPSELRIRP